MADLPPPIEHLVAYTRAGSLVLGAGMVAVGAVLHTDTIPLIDIELSKICISNFVSILSLIFLKL